MAARARDDSLAGQLEETPDYLKEVTDIKFQNISIKGYEKKSTGSFTRDEYYAYKIVSM